jgi:hypothetical protein
MKSDAERAQNMYEVMFNEQNSKRWNILVESEDPIIHEAARELLKDIRRILMVHLVGMENDANEIREAAEALGIELPEKKVH